MSLELHVGVKDGIQIAFTLRERLSHGASSSTAAETKMSSAPIFDLVCVHVKSTKVIAAKRVNKSTPASSCTCRKVEPILARERWNKAVRV